MTYDDGYREGKRRAEQEAELARKDAEYRRFNIIIHTGIGIIAVLVGRRLARRNP